MKRKTVAVCVTGYDWEYESRVVNGVYMRCQELDIDLLVFSNLMRRPEINSTRTLPPNAARGEAEIYNLINYDILDGIIILGDSMIEESIIADISGKAEKYRIPIVNEFFPFKNLGAGIFPGSFCIYRLLNRQMQSAKCLPDLY